SGAAATSRSTPFTSTIMHRLPYPGGGKREIEMVYSERAQRVDHRVGHRRQRAGGAGLARALHAERIGRRRHRMVVQLDARQDLGARHGVVHERAGEELAVLRVVLDVLGERLAEALRDAAVE